MLSDRAKGINFSSRAGDDPRIVTALARTKALGEVGVQVAAYMGDELIVDAWIGAADQENGIPVSADTLFPVFSIVKAVVATALHVQVERGLVDYDEAIATYWPEFARAGKGTITVRDVLVHRAGIPQMPDEVTPEEFGDWDRMVTHLQNAKPLFPPGTESTYLAYTFGWLVGEIVRRTDPKDRTFKAFVYEEVLWPLGVADFFLGVPAEQESRVATLYPAWYQGPRFDLSPYRAMATPPQIAPKPTVFNRSDVRRAFIPGANGIATARATARFFSLLANRGTVGDVRLLSEERVLSFREPRPRVDEVDRVLGHVVPIGMGGFWLGGRFPGAEPTVGNSPFVLCIAGGGQTVAWADLDNGLSAAICHNRMFSNSPPLSPDRHPFVELADAIRAVAGDAASGLGRAQS
jgi:CubicO group peptidase (beta-lactamase class C family)